MDEEKLIESAHVLFHPIRYRIVKVLKERPMHINEISDRIGKDRRLVSHHLLTLEEHGFLASRYYVSQMPRSKGKAIRIYWNTEKVREVMEELRDMLY